MRSATWLLGLAAAALAAWLAVSCEEPPTSSLIGNRPPTVAISAGPLRDSVSVTTVTFQWNASDVDGQVVRFIYALDDTAAASDWFETTRHEVTLLCTVGDSAGVDVIILPPDPREHYRFRGAHTFFLKAIDDDGALSATVALAFTAESFAPETGILTPSPGALLIIRSTIGITWAGTDPDGPADALTYSWRLVAVPNVTIMTPEEIEAALDDPDSAGEPWSPFAPSTSVRLDSLAVPRDYLFAVRARDQAEAREPRLRTPAAPGPTNVLRIQAREAGGSLSLCVSSSVKTTCFPTADERRKTFQIPANANIAFTWSGAASHYGGRIAGYSYGIDLTDLEESNPGWATESPTLTRATLRFDLPPGSRAEEHFLHVRARDDFGTTLIADVTLVVVPLTGDRHVLLVDDFGQDWRGRVPEDCQPPPPPEQWNSGADWPQDQCHDQILRDAIERGLAAVGHPDWTVDRYEPLDPITGRFSLREVEIDSTTFPYWVITGPVTLPNLARYRLVIWNLRSADTTQLRAMNQEGQDNFLAVYVEMGGEVWIMGTGTFSRTRSDPGSVGLSPFGFEPEDFLFGFLKVESLFEGQDCEHGCFRVSGSTNTFQRLNGFDGAYPSSMAAREGYDTLRVARPPFDSPIKGIPGCEGMAVPFGLDINPRLEPIGGRLDTLYFYQSNGMLQLVPPVHSYMDDAACALRYSGPGQGRLMVFGFPLYFMPPSQVDGVMSASLRWLLE